MSGGMNETWISGHEYFGKLLPQGTSAGQTDYTTPGTQVLQLVFNPRLLGPRRLIANAQFFENWTGSMTLHWKPSSSTNVDGQMVAYVDYDVADTLSSSLNQRILTAEAHPSRRDFSYCRPGAITVPMKGNGQGNKFYTSGAVTSEPRLVNKAIVNVVILNAYSAAGGQLAPQGSWEISYKVKFWNPMDDGNDQSASIYSMHGNGSRTTVLPFGIAPNFDTEASLPCSYNANTGVISIPTGIQNFIVWLYATFSSGAAAWGTLGATGAGVYTFVSAATISYSTTSTTATQWTALLTVNNPTVGCTLAPTLTTVTNLQQCQILIIPVDLATVQLLSKQHSLQLNQLKTKLEMLESHGKALEVRQRSAKRPLLIEMKKEDTDDDEDEERDEHFMVSRNQLRSVVSEALGETKSHNNNNVISLQPRRLASMGYHSFDRKHQSLQDSEVPLRRTERPSTPPTERHPRDPQNESIPVNQELLDCEKRPIERSDGPGIRQDNRVDPSGRSETTWEGGKQASQLSGSPFILVRSPTKRSSSDKGSQARGAAQ